MCGTEMIVPLRSVGNVGNNVSRSTHWAIVDVLLKPMHPVIAVVEEFPFALVAPVRVVTARVVVVRFKIIRTLKVFETNRAGMPIMKAV